MKEKVVEALAFLPLKKEEIEGLIEIPKDPVLGDFAFPCFSLSKTMRKNPIEIANETLTKIRSTKNFEKIQAVGPYVNFFIDRNQLTEKTIGKILREKDNYGMCKISNEKVMIEFSQTNTHKAFHVGHIRGTSLGESLARLFEYCGNKVVRVNYQGDTGMHVAKWLWCYETYHKGEEIKNDESWFAHIYTEAVARLAENEELQKDVDEINQALDLGNDKKLIDLWKKTREICLKSQKKIYEELNTDFDENFFESQFEKRGKAIAEKLVIAGIAKISDGATIIDFKEHGMPELGVWVILRKDGTVLYSAKDIALAEKKFSQYKIQKAMYVVGAEQQLHMAQLFKTLEMMKFKQASLCEYVPFSLVRLPEGKMSSRTGNNVLYSDFRADLMKHASEEIVKRNNKLSKDEVEKRALAIIVSAMKYTMLKQDTNKVIIFDKDEALRFEGDTGPYLLYSYSRAKSILRKATGKTAKMEVSVSECEKNLISSLDSFPNVVEGAYYDRSPATIAHYAYQLAQVFNEFYQQMKVIGEPEEAFRLKLVSCFAQVMKNALYLLGIDTIEEM